MLAYATSSTSFPCLLAHRHFKNLAGTRLKSIKSETLFIIQKRCGDVKKMSLHPRCLALNQITSLIQSVNKKNFKSTSAEIAGVS